MSTATPSITQYLKLFWACINPFIIKWVLPMHGVIGALDLYHTHLPAPLNALDIFDLFPSWSLLNWLAAACIIVSIGLVDGYIWERHLIQEAQSRSKPLVDATGTPYGISKKRGAAKFIAPVTIFVVLTGAYLFLPQEVKKKELTLPAPSPSAIDPQIYMECTQVPLPINIQPHSTAHIIPINKKRMQSVKWGFYEAPNSAGIEQQWPEKPLMDKATKITDNFGLFTWRCEMSNHGMINVFDIKMPITFDIGKEKITYDAIITPLDAGAKFSFYPVNDCPAVAIAVWPDTVQLQVLGEINRRKVPLHRTYKNPVEQVMMFFGSKTRFIGGEPCE